MQWGIIAADKSSALPGVWAIVGALLVAAVPALISYLASSRQRSVAIAAAERAAEDAQAARAATQELERLKLLEDRVREAKVNAYLPLITALGSHFGPGAKDDANKIDLAPPMQVFWTQSIIYASDDGQRAFGRMLQGAFNDAPLPVTVRLFSEFLLAARRDLAYDDTTLTGTDLWAAKINDLFSSTNPIHAGVQAESLGHLAQEHGWSVPWLGTTMERDGDRAP